MALAAVLMIGVSLVMTFFGAFALSFGGLILAAMMLFVAEANLN